MGGVDHELAIAADRKQTAVRMVRNVLREDLRGSHVLPTAETPPKTIKKPRESSSKVAQTGLSLTLRGTFSPSRAVTPSSKSFRFAVWISLPFAQMIFPLCIEATGS